MDFGTAFLQTVCEGTIGVFAPIFDFFGTLFNLFFGIFGAQFPTLSGICSEIIGSAT